MKSFAVVRAESHAKVQTALLDLRRYGRIAFSGPPKFISPDYADEILEKVMKRPLKNKCVYAALVSLNTIPSVAIGKLTKIHPPAHVVIISSNYDVFEELTKKYDMLPEFEVHKVKMVEEGSQNINEAVI